MQNTHMIVTNNNNTTAITTTANYHNIKRNINH